MPEITLLCEYATLNGGERSMLATLPGIRASGFTPTVMAPADGPLADALAAMEVELIAFDCRAPDGIRLPQSRLREKLSAALSRRRPALLHANSLSMGRLSGPVAVNSALPSISHIRDIVRLSAQAAADVNCHRRLLAVSQATRDFHVAEGLAAEKLHVVYNGVNLDEFQPRTASGYIHHELGLSPETLLVGTIGQIGLRKGQDVLFHAAAAIADQMPNVHYLIIGQRHSKKDESRRFERELHDALQGPLAERVHFLGIRDDVGRLLGELTLLVHPARQEPLGRVLLEAAAAGLAVVATNVGGTAEIFSFSPEKHAALLVPPDDHNDLAQAMLKLLDDSALRRRMGEAARRIAEDRFNVASTIKALLRQYEAAVQQDGHHPSPE